MSRKSSGSDGPKDDEEKDAMGRKVWDKDHFLERAKNNIMFGPERIGRRKDAVIPLPASQRTFLKQRSQELDLDRNLGKSQVVTQHTIKPMQGGYWCSVCECLIKDSSAWLEHINGRRHNRNLGMNMKVEKIGIDRVKAKLHAMRKEPEEAELEDIEARIQAVEDEQEEKKRRKKEAAQAFFAEAKKKKDAAKLEREAAIARGEAVPAKEAPPPLKEPPVLAPQVRALTAAVTDHSVSYDSLYALYQRVVSVRHEIANVSAELANREDATIQQRRKALLRVVVDRLRCVDDQTLPLSCVAADPAVAVLRKGLAKSLVNFANGIDCLKVSEHVNAKGHSIQYLTLEGSGPKGTGAEAVETNVGAEMLLSQVLVTMQGCGGVAPIGGLTGDMMIKERMKGVTSKLSKFLTHYPDIFQLGQGPNDKEMMCYLKDAVPVTVPAVADQGQFGQFSYTAGGPQAQQGLDQWGAMNAAGAQQGLNQWGAQMGINDGLGAPDPREQLVQMIVSFLQAKGGVATMSELGMEPTLKAAQKGVVAKLSKFLAQHPYFSVQTEGPQQMMTCRLVGM